jgi:predicted glycogen debranching enzyme
VPTLRKTADTAAVSVSTADTSVEALLSKQWLLTNSRGAYASSSIIGCNTSRYHGLLVGSLNPLANRMVVLANCLETVIIGGTAYNVSTFEFNGRLAPQGYKYVKRFRQDIGVHIDYEWGPSAAGPNGSQAGRSRLHRVRWQGGAFKLTKSIYLVRDADTVAVVYDFMGLGGLKRPVELILRPFAGLRDFHSLQKSYVRLCSQNLDHGLLVRHEPTNGCQLHLSCPSATFQKDPQWWFNFVYRTDRERGQDFSEDLWSPGFFKCHLDSPGRIVLWANLCPSPANGASDGNEGIQYDIEAVRRDLSEHQKDIRRKGKSARPAVRDQRYAVLCLAADQFVAQRNSNGVLQTTREYGKPANHEPRATVLAGFPWFADWGRDAFIALPGLLLTTGRLEEAKSVLTTFAAAADEGMIPNRFDDYSDTAHFNSIDASLWFIHAAFEYLAVTGDSQTFAGRLLPTIRWIIDSYYKGTRFGICADSDELITGGSEETQLTWMDAKCDGVVFTARFGKAVEVNALWHNSLCRLARFYADRDIQNAEHFKALSARVAASFAKCFWNDEVGYLNDCVFPDGRVDSSLRPNQIFAVSLPFSPLSPYQQNSVVEVVQKHLLTPFGLRTLAAGDSRYKGLYTGPQYQRDEAYHQGTVWPYLMGPFVQAYLRVNDLSRKSRKKCAEFIEPLMQHLTEGCCLGQLSEIFDGDPPHQPRGCIAQAWSVAEVIRACQLING